MNTCGVCQTTHSPVCPSTRKLRWPAEPLFELVGSHGGVVRKLGVSGSDVARAAVEGLSDRQADLWACRLGLHASMVWPDWDRAGLTVADDLFVNGNGWRRAWEWASA